MQKVNLEQKPSLLSSSRDLQAVAHRARAEGQALITEPQGLPNTGAAETAAAKPRI